MAKKEKLTIARANSDFKMAYEAKRSLIEREKEDFLFSLGEQWSVEEKAKLEQSGIDPVVDNRIQPNLFLLTGLERQNRSEFKAFPEGEEDGLKAEIATQLFKDAIRKSGYLYKSSEQFKDGIVCGESHLELYLDYTDSLINGQPVWRKCDGNTIFADPLSREYDFKDARWIYKLNLDIAREDLINLYPEKKAAIEKLKSGKLGSDMLAAEGAHRQRKDYPTLSNGVGNDAEKECESFDLIERYYKKWVETVFIGDKQTGEVKPVESAEVAAGFIEEYKAGIDRDLQAFQDATDQASMHAETHPGVAMEMPPAPPEQDPERFILIQRQIPEIWCFAYVPGMDTPLADERAWFYPKWKTFPFVPYFARFSTAPLSGDERHLLVQGLVHGVKGAQKKHNKAEILMLRHLNTSTNSGWWTEEDTWVDTAKVVAFGSTGGINLEYKTGKQKPERVVPAPLSQAHAQISLESAESIKAQLGINADLLAANESGGDSGRAISLRQKQGLLMVQELFDNHSRSRKLAGQMLLSQLGEMYDTETAMKILGEAFLKKNFPPLMMQDPDNPENPPMPMTDKFGQPMEYDKEMATLLISEVISGRLGEYDVTVGESVASDTQRMAVSTEVMELAAAMPGLVPPDVMVRYSQIPESAKNEIINAIQQAQMAAAQAAAAPPPPSGGGKKKESPETAARSESQPNKRERTQ